jgi:hypothetical protein
MEQDEARLYERLYRRADQAGRAAALDSRWYDYPQDIGCFSVGVHLVGEGKLKQFGEWLLGNSVRLAARSGAYALLVPPDGSQPQQFEYAIAFVGELRRHGIKASLRRFPNDAMVMEPLGTKARESCGMAAEAEMQFRASLLNFSCDAAALPESG